MFSNNQMILANLTARNSGNNKNYYFNNNLAYTEDHILVANVFLYNVQPKITPQILLPYLNTFGNVLKYDLNSRPMKRGRNTVIVKEGFVLFASPQSAANMLKCTVHHINGKRLSVKPNYSWNQPDQCAPSSSQFDTSLPSAIESLNDHCLEHIIRLLSLPDRIHFARTCLRFGNIYKQVSSVLDKSVDLGVFEAMTEWDVRDFFILSGSFVHELKGAIPKHHCQRICVLMGVHCPNLKTLDIWHTQINIGNMYKMFVNKDQLQKLLLRKCNIKNFYLPTMMKLQQLKSLDLSSNEELSGNKMDQLPATIESLTLNNCHNLDHYLLPKTCKALPKLKELHIKNTSSFAHIFEDLISDKCCESLEVVSLSIDEDNHVRVAELPSLKKLTIQRFGPLEWQNDVLWSWLVKHKSTQLEYLEVQGERCINANVLSKISQLSTLRTLILPNNISINDNGMEHLCALQELEEISLKYCSNVSNNAVLRLLMNCPKLQVLNLQGCDLSDTLLTDILLKLRRQIQLKETQRSLPIKLFVYGTKINKYSLSNPEVAAKDIIDVSLAAPSKSSGLCSNNMMDFFQLEFDGHESMDFEYNIDGLGFLTDDMRSTDSFDEFDDEGEEFDYFY